MFSPILPARFIPPFDLKIITFRKMHPVYQKSRVFDYIWLGQTGYS